MDIDTDSSIVKSAKDDALLLVRTVNDIYVDILKSGDKLASNINNINTLKNTELSEKQDSELDSVYKSFYLESSLNLIKVKELQKRIYTNLEIKRNELELKKDRVDRMQLTYENLLYKQAYLQREIKSCITNTPHLNEIEKELNQELGTSTYSNELSTIQEQTIQKLLEEQQARIHARNQVEVLQEEKAQLVRQLDKKRKLMDELPNKVENIQTIAKNIALQFYNIHDD